MKKKVLPDDLGSLSSHRAYLGKKPRRGSRVPFEIAPEKVFELQVSGLVKRLSAIGCRTFIPTIAADDGDSKESPSFVSWRNS